MANWVELMGWGARLVLVLLALLSIWSISIMFDRKKVFAERIGASQPDQLKEWIKSGNWADVKAKLSGKSDYLSNAIRAAVESGGIEKKDSETVDRAVQSFIVEERIQLEKGLSVLASLGSNAPFIGLFGTVMGIIQSFGILSSQQGSAMNAVMLGLAEALIATAVGLFVAIPALVAYNAFGLKLRSAQSQVAYLKDLLIAKMKA